MIDQYLDMSIETKFICRFCGHKTRIKKLTRGRPREYCNDDCKKGQFYLDRFMKISEKTNFTEMARKTLRGDLMTFMNQSLPHPVKSNLGNEITRDSFDQTLGQISHVVNNSKFKGDQ